MQTKYKVREQQRAYDQKHHNRIAHPHGAKVETRLYLQVTATHRTFIGHIQQPIQVIVAAMYEKVALLTSGAFAFHDTI